MILSRIISYAWLCRLSGSFAIPRLSSSVCVPKYISRGGACPALLGEKRRELCGNAADELDAVVQAPQGGLAGLHEEGDVSYTHLHHDGGYSTFRVNVTDEIVAGTNDLKVTVDNSKNDRVYPQKADFTFYGGIYRDCLLYTSASSISFQMRS